MISVVRGDVVPIQQPTIAIEIGQDGLGHLQGALFGLDQRRLKRVDVVASPEAFVAHDRNLAVDAVDGVKIIFHSDFFEDVGVSGVEATFFFDFSELATARAVEGVAMVQEEHALGVILAIRILAIADAAFHAGHRMSRPLSRST